MCPPPLPSLRGRPGAGARVHFARQSINLEVTELQNGITQGAVAQIGHSFYSVLLKCGVGEEKRKKKGGLCATLLGSSAAVSVCAK